MKAGTHLVGALALAAAYDTFAPDNWATAATSVELAVYGGAALFGGLLPDICQPNSKAAVVCRCYLQPSGACSDIGPSHTVLFFY